jgi:acetyl-CoA carboxylase beta subunit
MPYVKCSSCALVTYSASAYATLECCPHCGAGLPVRRVVVSMATGGRAVPEPPAEAESIDPLEVP